MPFVYIVFHSKDIGR